MKKTLSMLLAFSMLLGLLTTMGFAAGETYTITIDNDATGHTYEAYQIFTGDLHDSTLSNIVWGSGVTEEGKTKLGDAADKAESLTTTNVVAFADEVSVYLGTSSGRATAPVEGKYTISGLAAGYYLVMDTAVITGHDAKTAFILEIVADTEVAPKDSVPTVEKKVIDTNDTTGETTGWQDSADYDIGDSVPFQLKATLGAEHFDKYEKYKVVFHDTMSAGLTLNKGEDDIANEADFIVKIDDGTALAADAYDVEVSGTNITITINDVKAQGSAAGSVITVEYTATLNENAVIGSAGNPNEVYLEFSNNPNWNGEGTEETGTTPTDKVIVFTYKVVVNKVDSEKQALEGAGFTLYKKNATGEYAAIGEELKGDTLTTFTWTGLDDGDYKLSETTTPAGYNTIPDQEFTVTADHEILADNPTLTSLSGKATTGEVTFTADLSDGSLTSNVVNNKGSVLPETGGIGTTIFYVLGGLMAVGAGVLLVAKKRMDA